MPTFALTRLTRRTAAAALLLCTFTAGPALAADPLAIGVLLPGSRSDKGWMESGYDGLTAVQKRLGAKIKVQMIENISNADMEQALTTLAQKNKLVIGIGGQTQAALMKVAKRFPKVNFAVIGGNRDESLPNVSGYDVKQAQIAYVRNAVPAQAALMDVLEGLTVKSAAHLMGCSDVVVVSHATDLFRTAVAQRPEGVVVIDLARLFKRAPSDPERPRRRRRRDDHAARRSFSAGAPCARSGARFEP